MEGEQSIIPIERIRRSIILIRGHKVILDRDLASMYEVTTSDLNKAVIQNIEHFPEDFVFQVTRAELSNLRFRFGMSGWHRTKKLPRAFTEQGVAMLSSVFKHKRTVKVNIAIMRTFLKMRETMVIDASLRRKLESMERKYEERFELVFKILSELVMADIECKKPIGFLTEVEG
ncbi:MAG: ORF6N domain-containing protein [Planctomycetota bacterium]|jgi:hypothetical protein